MADAKEAIESWNK